MAKVFALAVANGVGWGLVARYLEINGANWWVLILAGAASFVLGTYAEHKAS